jgi:hypothetical protein
MRQQLSYRILSALCLVCLWAVIWLGLNGFIPVVTAQEPTADAAAFPTPTTAPTWTPTVVGTPDPHASPTAAPGTPATPAGRMVDFRVDDRKVSVGECATFSWLVRGDFDKVEFDQHDDGKNPVLVPEEQYDAEECPTKATDYSLIVSWLDGTQTKKTIGIKIEDSDDGDGGDSGDAANQTAVPVGTSGFLPVTPLPISGMSGGGASQGATPQSIAYQQNAMDGVVVTPVGALSSVVLLPETGYGPPPAADEGGVADSSHPAYPRWKVWLAFAAESGAFLGAIAVIGLILRIKLTKSEAFR